MRRSRGRRSREISFARATFFDGTALLQACRRLRSSLAVLERHSIVHVLDGGPRQHFLDAGHSAQVVKDNVHTLWITIQIQRPRVADDEPYGLLRRGSRRGIAAPAGAVRCAPLVPRSDVVLTGFSVTSRG